MKIKQLTPIFVEYIPLELEEGIIYISMKYATASHLCACGCKQKVVTPISPNSWSLLYDGESITLSPSIGNYEQECNSHYFIHKNQIVWCSNQTHHQIQSVKKKKKGKKKRFYWFWNKKK